MGLCKEAPTHLSFELYITLLPIMVVMICDCYHYTISIQIKLWLVKMSLLLHSSYWSTRRELTSIKLAHNNSATVIVLSVPIYNICNCLIGAPENEIYHASVL